MTDTLTDLMGSWTSIPNIVIEMLPDLGNAAFSLFCYLRKFSNFDKLKAGKDDVWPAYETIMKGTGMARQTVADALKKLEDYGLLVKKYRKHNSTIYTLKLPSQEVQKVDFEDAEPPIGKTVEVQKVDFENASKSKKQTVEVQKIDLNKTNLTRPNQREQEEYAAAGTADAQLPAPEDLPVRRTDAQRKGDGGDFFLSSLRKPGEPDFTGYPEDTIPYLKEYIRLFAPGVQPPRTKKGGWIMAGRMIKEACGQAGIVAIEAAYTDTRTWKNPPSPVKPVVIVEWVHTQAGKILTDQTAQVDEQAAQDAKQKELEAAQANWNAQIAQKRAAGVNLSAIGL